MPARLVTFAFAATVSFTAAAMADGSTPGKKVSVDISGFCGQWQVIVPGTDPAQKSADISHCTQGQNGFAVLNCDVEIPAGRHQLHIHAMHGASLVFKVDEAGAVEVEAPNAGIMADGGQGRLKLRLAKPAVDKAGYAGPGGFERVSWDKHPQKACTDRYQTAAIPMGSSFLLTPTDTWITSDSRGHFHSTKTTAVSGYTVYKKGLVFRTARLLVYPDKDSRSEPWTVFTDKTADSVEPANQGKPGLREVVLIQDNKYQLSVAGQKADFSLTTTCQPQPEEIKVGAYGFRLFAQCD